jgi:hypothetical protein
MVAETARWHAPRTRCFRGAFTGMQTQRSVTVSGLQKSGIPRRATPGGCPAGHSGSAEMWLDLIVTDRFARARAMPGCTSRSSRWKYEME